MLDFPQLNTALLQTLSAKGIRHSSDAREARVGAVAEESSEHKIACCLYEDIGQTKRKDCYDDG